MEKKQNMKKTVLCMILAATVFAVLSLSVLPGSIMQTKGSTITYSNKLFTKDLYQNTKKISFGTDAAAVVKDNAAVKKVYRLLAGMKLKSSKKTVRDLKGDSVSIVIHKKNGGKKTYTFTGNYISSGKTVYTIATNNPVSKLHEIFKTSPAKEDGTYRIASAEYPVTAPYPDETEYIKNGELDDSYFKAYNAWWEDIRARRGLSADYSGTLDGFFTKSAKQFLSTASGENLVYSPLNVYMALGMLAELTDGNSRQQILDLLGSKDIETLRKQANDLWNANYRNDGAETSILASSLWLDQDIKFNQPALDILAKNYYASSYQGKMGSEEMDKALQDWLNEQTGGLLSDHVSEERLRANTVLALAASVYYRSKWHEEFRPEQTKQDTFHAESGDIVCDFMHKDQCAETYYQGEHFSAVSQRLEGSGSMWFLLPKEGTGTDDLLNDSQAVEFLMSQNRSEWKDQKQVLLNLSVPKFDVSSKMDLRDGLQALGVTDVFDENVSDFSPMTADRDQIYLSQADHAGRTAIDEKGVTAAAYTVMAADAGGALMSEEEIDFVLNRPFLFAITGSDGTPLFAGVVNQP